MPDIDRTRLTDAARRRAGRIHRSDHPRSRELFEQAQQPVRQGADDLDEQVERRLPALPRPRPRATGSPTSTATPTSTSRSATPARWPATPRGRPSRPSPAGWATWAASRRCCRRADAQWVGAELTRRFGMPLWSFTLSATDANRWAVRLARLATGRPKVLVFGYCYHGSVDETFAMPGPDGKARVAPGQRRAPGAARPHHPGRDVERPGLGRARAGPRRRRRDPHRAGADQHRHRAARARASWRGCASSPPATARC